MTHSQTPGLDTLAEGSQYALEKLHLARQAELNHSKAINSRTHSDGAFKLPARRDSHSEARTSIRKNSSAPPAAIVRRRISRACDQCNQLRTKCDGQTPCGHCTEFSLTCEYARERKKRGKASKKDLAEAAAKIAATSGSNPSDTSNPTADLGITNSMSLGPSVPGNSYESNDDSAHPYSNPQITRTPTIANLAGNPQPSQPSHSRAQQGQHLPSNIDNITMNNYGQINDVDRSVMHMPDLRDLQPRSPPALIPAGFNGFHDAYNLMNPEPQNNPNINTYRFGNPSEDPSATQFIGLSPPAQSPGWLQLPSPSANFPSLNIPTGPTSSLRYPVLQPVMPHLMSIIPQSLACDLLDLYFASSSSSHFFPQSPYVVGCLFRKTAFLHPTRPRVCSPALLASILWVAAQTSEAAFLTSPPSARGRVCQKLLELTVGLLRPLIHGPAPGETSPNYAANMVINGVALGGFGVSMDQLGAESSATGAVDDVATYIHLATVVSASEYKAASIRWWAAAWSLARELKLGRELPPTPSQPRADDVEGNAEMELKHSMTNGTSGSSGHVTEEEREERRRVWWLLYVMDRHLALCYNRPLTLLDKECESLLQPMNDDIWHSGDFANAGYRRAGPSFEFTGHSMFGYFLPLMTILGEIVDLYHARNHPRFGVYFRNSRERENQQAEIANQLDIYGQSLCEFQARHASSLALANTENEANFSAPGIDHVSPSARSTSTAGSRMNESLMQTKMVVAYGTHIMHVLHILLAGKWDPISLLDDTDLWISSDGFITAMGHAVSAAEAAADILEYDPDLSFMPFFFGIYLLQGSFLLLLTADKLQGDATPSVVKACETIVRAHEACVVTLNTEYQRNFRKVMRSALAQVRGRIPEDFGEQQQRRREVLALYRWTGDGSGLAL
ncbi:putative C6 transcription factor [Talaromyces proteolyticus]|uniref:Xylanolytic transcriptional activator xlnR n=1 Tax=Talaromyces proteolyticus TaxID=1131652 RepID=A0AAD4PXM1_9EURO|nr:putative C6 transcription factor [Talaromyces proteolyticus]KAH8696529.1 putative C6 transcription factor [Talaromyces proteolyticus]